jgi:hypothetical protein
MPVSRMHSLGRSVPGAAERARTADQRLTHAVPRRAVMAAAISPGNSPVVPANRQKMKAEYKAKENALDGKDEKGNPLKSVGAAVADAMKGRSPKNPAQRSAPADPPNRRAMKSRYNDFERKLDGEK